MANRKGHMSFLIFCFWGFKFVPIYSALYSALGNLTYFLNTMWAWYWEKQLNLKI